MRALTSEDSGSPTENFLRVLDQFAALHSYVSATPTGGGYRVLAPRRAAKGTARRIFASRPSSAPQSPGARMQLTGFLSVLFIGGLGLAVLAGPANCPCSSPFAKGQTSLARLGYVQNAHFMNARETVALEAERAVLTDAFLLPPDASATGVSPITTSALEPSRELPTPMGDDLAAVNVGRTSGKLEGLAEAGPPTPVRLAAAPGVESDVQPTLPVIEVANPPMSEVTAIEAEREVAPKARSTRKRAATRAYRSPNQQAGRAKKKSGDGMTVERAPKWAQQMFTTPWQSQAFSYTR